MSNEILDDGFKRDPSTFDSETIQKINTLKKEANDNLRHVKNGRDALLVMIVLTILGTVIGLAWNPYEVTPVEIIIEAIFLIIVYAVSAFFVGKNPRAALITPLVVYILVSLLAMLVDPTSIYKGIILKAIIIYYLVLGIRSSYVLNDITQKLTSFGTPEEELNALKKLKNIPLTPTN